MIRLNKIMTLGAIAAISFTLSCTPSEREHRDTAAMDVDSNVDVTTKAQVSSADINMDGAEKAFILSTYSQSLYIAELANIAGKSRSENFKALAKSVTPTYQKMIADMESIAKGKGLMLERNLSEAQKSDLDALRNLSSPTLDQQLLQKMQSVQAAFTTLFEEGKHLHNTDLNDYAANAMKVIQDQQEKTTKLVNAVNNSGSQSTRPGEVSIR